MEINPFTIADIIGIIAFSISGFFAAVYNKLDILGIVIASSLTALGGGVVRDVVLGNTPFAFSAYYPSLTILVTLLIAFIFKLHNKKALEQKSLFIFSDSIGLVAFSITGTLLAIGAELNFFGVIILSVTTAVGGGVIRDTLLNKIPSLLTSDFYGTIAILVAILLMLLNRFDFMSDLSIAAVALFTTALRVVAYKRKWQLPKLAEG